MPIVDLDATPRLDAISLLVPSAVASGSCSDMLRHTTRATTRKQARDNRGAPASMLRCCTGRNPLS